MYYKEKFPNGQIYSINEYESIEREEIDLLDINPTPVTSIKRKVKDTLYILSVSKEENLINGFLPIKELIYDIRDLKNFNTFKKLIEAKIKVLGIKTDSLMIADSPKNVETVKELFDFSDKIGNHKLERNKYLLDSEIKCSKNKLPKVTKVDIREHSVNNEYNSEEILSIMNNKNVFVKGILPGVGKTTACKNREKSLFVSPYYKLCQDLRKGGYDAITLNKLLG